MFNNLIVMLALTIHALGYPMGRLASGSIVSALANFKVLATKHPTLSQSIQSWVGCQSDLKTSHSKLNLKFSFIKIRFDLTYAMLQNYLCWRMSIYLTFIRLGFLPSSFAHSSCLFLSASVLSSCLLFRLFLFPSCLLFRLFLFFVLACFFLLLFSFLSSCFCFLLLLSFDLVCFFVCFCSFFLFVFFHLSFLSMKMTPDMHYGYHTCWKLKNKFLSKRFFVPLTILKLILEKNTLFKQGLVSECLSTLICFVICYASFCQLKTVDYYYFDVHLGIGIEANLPEKRRLNFVKIVLHFSFSTFSITTNKTII